MVVATGDQSMVYLWAHNIANIWTVAFNHIFTCLFIIFRKIIQTKSIIWLSTERQATSCPHKSGPGCRLKPACTHFGSRIPSTERVGSLLLHLLFWEDNATSHLTPQGASRHQNSGWAAMWIQRCTRWRFTAEILKYWYVRPAIPPATPPAWRWIFVSSGEKTTTKSFKERNCFSDQTWHRIFETDPSFCFLKPKSTLVTFKLSFPSLITVIDGLLRICKANSFDLATWLTVGQVH